MSRFAAGAHAYLLLFGITLLLVLAPFGRAGTTPSLGTVLALGSLALLTLGLWSAPSTLGKDERLWILALIGLPWLYLLPLPANWVAHLPGHALYAEIANLLVTPAPSWQPVSLDPPATLSIALRMLAPAAILVAVRQLSPRDHLFLIWVLLGIAAFIACWGILQWTPAGRWLDLDGPTQGAAFATYPNRNHAAGLLVMILPLAVLRVYALPSHPGIPLPWHHRLGWGLLVLLLVVGLIMTRSRFGVFLGLIGLLLTSMLGQRALRGWDWQRDRWQVAVVISLALLGSAFVVLTQTTGGAAVVARWFQEDISQDARWTLWRLTWELAVQFWPLGSGPGTFAAAVLPHQPLSLGMVQLNHAHQSYLEWLAEGGLPALLLVTWAAVMLSRQWVRLGKQPHPPYQAAAGLGLGLLLIHDLAEFNLAIPANQIVAAAVAGLFLAKPTVHFLGGKDDRSTLSPVARYR